MRLCGDSMDLYIRESNKKKALILRDKIIIDTNNYFDFKSLDFKDIIKYDIFNNEFLLFFCKNQICLDAIYRYSISLLSYEGLEKILIHNKISLNLLKDTIQNYHKKYIHLLKNRIDSLALQCSKDNFLKALVYAKNNSMSDIIIKGESISLGDYYYLLKDINLKKYDRCNIRIIISETFNDMSLQELYNMTCKIKNAADGINKLNLSPMEKIMYAYDIVKKRIYKNNENNLSSSRNIDEVLDSDYIVCVGYARLFNALISFLGIESKMILSDENEHARSLAYVKDKKYNIDGFLVFDPTFDSRKSTTDNEYINRYNYFALPVMLSSKNFPIEEMENIRMSFGKFVNYVSGDNDSDRIINMENTIEELFKMMGLKEKEIDFINIEKMKDNYKLLMKKLYSTEITLDDFVSILYNTRRGEYSTGEIDEIDKEKMKKSAISREHNIRKLFFDEMDFFDRLMLVTQDEGDSSYLDKNSEQLMTRLLNRKISTNEDLLDLRLVKVLKKRLSDIQK